MASPRHDGQRRSLDIPHGDVPEHDARHRRLSRRESISRSEALEPQADSTNSTAAVVLQDGGKIPRVEGKVKEKEEGTDSEHEGSVSDYDDKTKQKKSEPAEKAYHVFVKRKKWQLVLIVSLAGLFSPLSSNIYFPALGAIAEV